MNEEKKTYKKQITLSASVKKMLEVLVAENGYTSETEAIREAIRNLFDKKRPVYATSKRTVKPTAEEACVADGGVVAVRDGVRVCLYVKGENNEISQPLSMYE